MRIVAEKITNLTWASRPWDPLGSSTSGTFGDTQSGRLERNYPTDPTWAYQPTTIFFIWGTLIPKSVVMGSLGSNRIKLLWTSTRHGALILSRSHEVPIHTNLNDNLQINKTNLFHSFIPTQPTPFTTSINNIMPKIKTHFQVRVNEKSQNVAKAKVKRLIGTSRITS